MNPRSNERFFCAELRSLVYEVCEGDVEELKELEDLIDEITGKALGMDMSGCLACKEDEKASVEASSTEALYS